MIHLRHSSLAGNNQEWNIWGRIMADGRPPALFTCPQCAALYQVLKVEAGLETAEKKITCQVCGAPLVGREEKFVLKYFLLRKPFDAKGTIRLKPIDLLCGRAQRTSNGQLGDH